MKKAQKIIGIVIILALIAVVVWYFVSGQNSNNQPAATSNTGVLTQAATKDKIRSNWEKFFAGTTSAQDKINLLQNGQQYAQVIQGQAQSATAKATTATVSNVALNGTTATVTYTIDIAGKPTLTNQKGQAVKSNGNWYVGDAAFCNLLKLGGTLPPNCPAQ